jgi:hypothetical protein
VTILEKEVWVRPKSSNIKHFENLGYFIPRYEFKKGIFKIREGTRILIKVQDLQKSSMVHVTKVCDECGVKIENQPYDAIIKARKKLDGKDRCFDCGKKKSRITMLDSIKYEKSLECYAIENDKKYLIKEYSEKNEKKPSEISYGSGQEYLWDCPTCFNVYKATSSSRTNMESGCPYCCGATKKVLIGYNDLWTTHPKIAKLLKNPDIGYELTHGSNKKVSFICPYCSNEKSKSPMTIVRQGFGCTKCGDGVTFPEKVMFSFLEQLNVRFESQKKFDWSEKKIYDFYLPDFNSIIETHGEQHYRYTGRGKTVADEQKNDAIKESLAMKNGLDNYIIIDCSKSNINFISENINESKLSVLFDISKIDWNMCNEFASSSNLVKEVCDLWNSGIRSTVEIGKIVRLERGTVMKYLKRGKELSWCDYDSKQIQRENGLNSNIKSKAITRKVIQLSLEGHYIKEWLNITDAGRELGINRSNITSACRGRYKFAGDFKWMYKEDYEKLLIENN